MFLCAENGEKKIMRTNKECGLAATYTSLLQPKEGRCCLLNSLFSLLAGTEVRD
jgi:hypothetical protein